MLRFSKLSRPTTTRIRVSKTNVKFIIFYNHLSWALSFSQRVFEITKTPSGRSAEVFGCFTCQPICSTAFTIRRYRCKNGEKTLPLDRRSPAAGSYAESLGRKSARDCQLDQCDSRQYLDMLARHLLFIATRRPRKSNITKNSPPGVHCLHDHWSP